MKTIFLSVLFLILIVNQLYSEKVDTLKYLTFYPEGFVETSFDSITKLNLKDTSPNPINNYKIKTLTFCDLSFDRDFINEWGNEESETIEIQEYGFEFGTPTLKWEKDFWGDWEMGETAFIGRFTTNYIHSASIAQKVVIMIMVQIIK